MVQSYLKPGRDGSEHDQERPPENDDDQIAPRMASLIKAALWMGGI